MNCKPGDLAILVRDESRIHDGRIFVVVGPASRPAHWETDPLLVDPDGRICEPCDGHLRPIRDPGDDAVDETLLWLPSPTKELA